MGTAKLFPSLIFRKFPYAFCLKGIVFHSYYMFQRTLNIEHESCHFYCVFVTMELDSPSSHSLSLYEKERLGNALKINLLYSVKTRKSFRFGTT